LDFFDAFIALLNYQIEIPCMSVVGSMIELWLRNYIQDAERKFGQAADFEIVAKMVY
jgi:hypothetical protein